MIQRKKLFATFVRFGMVGVLATALHYGLYYLLHFIMGAYVAFMALCRLVIGRHYLSDTLAAAFVMLLLYLGMRKTKWYRAGARELTAPGT